MEIENRSQLSALKLASVGACVALAVFFLAMIFSSFSFLQWEKIVSTFRSESFRASLWLSFWSASVSTLLATLFGVPAAYFLSRSNFRGKIVIDTLLDVPTFLSPIATGTLLLMLFQTAFGRWLESMGISFVYSVASVVIAQFTIIVSLNVRLMKATFDTVPQRYESLARILGCSSSRAFARVTLPMASNGILAAVIICWARAFGEFGATVTLAGAMPRRTEVLTTGIHLKLATADLEAAVVLILVLVMTSLFVLLTLRFFSDTKRCKS